MALLEGKVTDGDTVHVSVDADGLVVERVTRFRGTAFSFALAFL